MNLESKNIKEISEKLDGGHLTPEQTQEFIEMSEQQLSHMKEVQ